MHHESKQRGERAVLAPGAVFAGYTVERVLGVGGVGSVYLVTHPRLPRRAALKLVHPELTGDECVRARVQSEMALAARLQHPNIVDVHDTGREGDQLWIAMHYVKGTTAAAAIRSSGPMAAERAVSIIGETAQALDYAHRMGVLHGDVKPGNIWLERDGSRRAGGVGLADAGIAQAVAETMANLHYAAPERFEGGVVDERADVYSLGATLFELLTGHPPYPGVSLPQLRHAHLMAPVPGPSAVRPGLAPGFDAVLAAALAKNRADRYPSCGALAAAAAVVFTQHADTFSPPDPAFQADLLPVPAPVADIDTRWAAHTQRPPPVAAPGWAPSWPASGRAPQLAAVSSPRPRQRRTRVLVLAGILAVIAVVAAGVLGYKAPNHPLPQPSERRQSTSTQTVVPFTGLNTPDGVAVDSAGNVFVTDFNFNTGNARVVEFAAGSSTQKVLPFTGLNVAAGVAVDSAGNVYVTDTDNNRVVELAAGSSTQRVLPFTGLSVPLAVAVDSAGNVYVTDTDNNRVVELAAGSSTQQLLPFTGVSHPSGVAVDSAGDVYVTDTKNDRLVELAAGSSTQRVVPFTGLDRPAGVTVDSAGNIYVADFNNGRVVELAAGSSTQQLLPFTVLNHPTGVAVDSAGNVYVADYGNNRVVKLTIG